MMKPKLIIVLFLLPFIKLSSQVNKGYLDLSVGIVSPNGEIAEQSSFDTMKGYAMPGFCYSIRYEKSGRSGLGFFINFQNSSMEYDVTSYARDYSFIYLRGMNMYAYESAFSSYNTKNLNFGMQYTLNRRRMTKWVPFFGGGFSLNTDKSMDVSYSNLNGTEAIRIREKADRAFALCYNFGLLIQHYITDKRDFFVKLDYMSQTPNFDTERTYYRNGLSTKNVKGVEKRKLSYLGFCVGFKYRLARKLTTAENFNPFLD